MGDLLKREDAAIQQVQSELSAGNPISGMMQAIIDRGITPETAATMQQMTALYYQMEERNAAKAFAAAKCALQAELPEVVAKRVIPSKDGTVRSTFAAYEDIMDTISPYLSKHGFSVSFTMENLTENGKDRIVAVCKLTHEMGHSETNRFAVRISAPPMSSDAQADGATRSYARRGALCDCLNIVVDHDNDARLEGDFITPVQAESLESRVKATGSDRERFLKLAGAKSFGEIRTGKYAMLDAQLMRKEKSGS